MTIRERLARGDFNDMNQEEQPNGSVLVTLARRGDNHVYRMWIKDLHQPSEVVIKEEVTDVC